MRLTLYGSRKLALWIGFITNPGTYEEEFNTGFIYPGLVHGRAINAAYAPILSAYVAVDYKEGEVIQQDIQNYTPVWQANLISLGPYTKIIIRKNPKGGYEAYQINAAAPNSFEAEGISPPIVHWAVSAPFTTHSTDR